MNQIAIALSVILSFVAWEFLGLASGGMICAGYLALFISSPIRILCTIALSLLVYLIMILLDKVLIIYGKRRFMLCVVLGIVLTFIWSGIAKFSDPSLDIRSIGFIVPGLIANDMLKQGVLKTLGVLAIVTMFVKLILMLSVGLAI